MVMCERNVVSLCMRIGGSINFSLEFKFSDFVEDRESGMVFLWDDVKISD